jgi:phosphoglycerate-specific signal transduction histidine kinase
VLFESVRYFLDPHIFAFSVMARLLLQLLAFQVILIAGVVSLFASSKVQQGVKYQLQQKVLTLGSSYTIKDDKNRAVYKVGSAFLHCKFHSE